jgi:enoyl-CoA hydratase
LEFEILDLKTEDGIAIVTNNRPQALNALNSQFFSEMDGMIEKISSRQDISVMIITGEGKAFAAGADIVEMVDMTETQGTEFSKTGQNTFRSLELLEIPVIAAINGFCLGGGNELALACDIRIASSKAKFGQPEVNLGLIPGYAATQRLPRLIGLSNALYLLMTADMITAEQAFRMGLIQKVTEPEELMPEVIKIAKKIASKGPMAVKKVKKVAREGLLTNFDDGAALESKEFGSLFGNQGAEGMRAFLEKREPKW